uniref:11 kDa late embryogenesis abundant protein n=1 Tax=Erigeron canadensis TaxID=72917 RepID=UPI001CB9BC3B|nr:11 kDa late embryogenesis abundant protein [Erigeron canadensis]
METVKNAAASIKETAANIGAANKSGMEKTKAILQEKGEKMTAHDPTQKQLATEKKESRINEAEYEKQVAREQNATQRQAAEATTGTQSYSTTGATGEPMGGHQMSALPGHGTGVPAGNVVEGVIKSHPIGTNTGTGTTLADHNLKSGGGAGGYTTGGAYR